MLQALPPAKPLPCGDIQVYPAEDEMGFPPWSQDFIIDGGPGDPVADRGRPGWMAPLPRMEVIAANEMPWRIAHGASEVSWRITYGASEVSWLIAQGASEVSWRITYGASEVSWRIAYGASE
eukprot:375277-Pelagomonas_calceolata.AAC.1